MGVRDFRGIEFGNACYHSVQSSRLLSKNLKITIYKTIILPVVLYGCETWSLILREQHRLGVILYICILSHIAISLPLFFSVFCAAY
jgi:hypothetical protein